MNKEILQKLGISLMADGKIGLKLDLDLPKKFKPIRAEMTAQDSSILSGIEESYRKELVGYIWRVLSASLLPNYIDFRNTDRLKQIITDRLAEHTPLFIDHSRSVSDWIGITGSSFWEEAADEETPAGINVALYIDPVKTADIYLIRGIEIGAIRSASVTLYFLWEKSHPNLPDEYNKPNSFWRKLGEVVDGEIVRIIPTKYLDIPEISIVWSGMDPDAKLKGKVSPEPEMAMTGANIDITNNGGNNIMLKKLAVALGIPEGEVSEDKIPILLQEFSKKQISAATEENEKQIVELKAKVDILEKDLAAEKVKAESSIVLTKAGEEYLSDLKKESIRLYKLSAGEDKAQKEVIEALQSSKDLLYLKTAIEMYKPVVEAKLGKLKCQDCGSFNVSRQQSITKSETDPKQKDTVQTYHEKELNVFSEKIFSGK
ncbi:MAG: hypothetical protein KBA11_07800 [Sedimentibacter sp.]|nr:hypothetical protein [Sedimentibacter sp.]